MQKQWHLGNPFRNHYKHQFESIFLALPKNSHVLLAIGEIDCRLYTGILVRKRKFPEKPVKHNFKYSKKLSQLHIVNKNSDHQHNVTILGVPCPNLNVGQHAHKDIAELVEVIDFCNNDIEDAI